MRQLLNVGDVFDIPGRGGVLIARTELSEFGFNAVKNWGQSGLFRLLASKVYSDPSFGRHIVL